MTDADAGERRQLHFTRDEYADRLARLRGRMAEDGLDAMLLFAQESHYWLTGFDTFGFCFFQTILVLPDGLVSDGGLTLLTRSADLRQAQRTSILEDIRVWKDAIDADPTEDLKALLEEKGLAGARIGVEMNTHGLTARNWMRLDARFGDWCELIDASRIVSELRLVKSAAEIAYVREAARIADACYLAGRAHIRAGESEALVLAAMQGENFARGGDYPGNEFIIGSGPATRPGGGQMSGALLCRYYSGRRVLSAEDQITLEWAGVWRHYHAAMMRTVPVGRALPEHERMFAAARDALLACEAAMVPGAPMAAAFDAHARTLDEAGLGHARLNACGYALGARFTPSWMEDQMFYEGAPTVMRPNMVFFLHMILMDSETGAAMTLGRTSLVGETSAEPLSALPLELDVAL